MPVTVYVAPTHIAKHASDNPSGDKVPIQSQQHFRKSKLTAVIS